ncbi:MAG: tRNA dihydrouridine synthase DusB [Spirochaetes bacterium]|nr:tRNA dihydrouridine synthase DusB [Spirochaetota bacterium]
MISIGNIKIEGNLVLAPMAGYTDSPYRRIAKNYGAALVVTELISADGIIRGNRKTMELLRFTEAERPIGIQLFGSDPDVMAEAAKRAEEMHPDFIDINIGCSVRRVLRGGSGAGLLSDPGLLGKIASTVVKSVRLPVSAKIRIGTDADNKNYIEIVNILQDSGIAFMAVHGRTRAQGFKGDVDWNAIAEIKAESSVPVIGNGDIRTYEEAMARLASTGCDAVMIGRAAVGNPWIFNGRIPDSDGIAKQIKEHLELMLEFYGEKGIKLFRKHIAKYIRGMKDSAKFRALLVNAETKEEILEHLDKFG